MAHILLVDDDEDVRLVMTALLREAGYEVSEADGGAKALACFAALRPDLVILDVLMPECDGVETLRELHRRAPQVPVVMMSGGGRVGTVYCLELARAMGAQKTLAKPFPAPALLDAVQQVLAGARPPVGSAA